MEYSRDKSEYFEGRSSRLIEVSGAKEYVSVTYNPKIVYLGPLCVCKSGIVKWRRRGGRLNVGTYVL